MELPEILINHITKTYTGIDIEHIVGIYIYGSRVYGTANKKSDWDFVVINTDGVDYEYMSDDIDIHYITVETFKNKLNQHDIMALEIYYQNKQGYPIKEYDMEFELDLSKLRQSVSSVCNNSFVKFKKKLTLENEDNWIGIKSCFHALRIAELGRLIATGSRKVLDTDTYLWTRIKQDAKECNYDWEALHAIYKPLFNEAMTEFRLVAPKVIVY